MDVTEVLSTSYESVPGDERVAAVAGRMRETGARTVVVVDGEAVGVVTRRDLAARGHDPDTKARTVVRHVGRASVDDDVRRAARLLVGSRADLLPVLDGDDLVGVVTAAGLLGGVREFLGVLGVADAASDDPTTVAPDATLGEAVHLLRETGVVHLPVVADGEAVGVVSVHDLVGFATRETSRASGGSPRPALAVGGGRARGGFGERAGDRDRLLDLPVETVMSAPVETVRPDEPLDEAVGRMLDADVSSLVVVEDGAPTGVLTTTDALRTPTWEPEPGLPVRITDVDLLGDLSPADVSATVERATRKFGRMTVFEATVHLHEHAERLRDTPLILARLRLFTDRGHFVGTGEGYGARHALSLARNAVERQVLDGKEYGRSKKHPDRAAEWDRLYGWWVAGEPRPAEDAATPPDPAPTGDGGDPGGG